MHSTIAIDIAAPADLVFDLARDSSRWERLLPHYARSRARRRPGGRGRRRLRGPPAVPARGRPRARPAGGLARAHVERAGDPAAAFRPRRRGHARDGRDVADRDARAGGVSRGDRPRLPAARRAVRGLRRPSVHPSDRRPDAGNVQGPRRGARRRPTIRSLARDGAIGMTDRRRIWITGIGIITAIGTGKRRVPGRAPGRPVAGHPDRPLRSVPVPVAGRGAGRRLRSAGLDAAQDRPPARPVQPVRAGRRPARARRRGADARRARRGAPAADRDLPGLGARRHRLRRGAARALPREGHPPGRPEPRAGGLRRGGAGQPRHRARRPRADPVDGELVRVGCGRARRGARGPARGADRRGDRGRRRDPAQPARVRGVRHHPGPVGRPQRRAGHGGAAVRRGPRRLRHGRGRGAARPRGGRGRRGARARSRTPS